MSKTRRPTPKDLAGDPESLGETGRILIRAAESIARFDDQVQRTRSLSQLIREKLGKLRKASGPA